MYIGVRLKLYAGKDFQSDFKNTTEIKDLCDMILDNTLKDSSKGV